MISFYLVGITLVESQAEQATKTQGFTVATHRVVQHHHQYCNIVVSYYLKYFICLVEHVQAFQNFNFSNQKFPAILYIRSSVL